MKALEIGPEGAQKDGERTMNRQTTYTGMMGDWRHLLEMLEANGEDLPQLAPLEAKLDGLLKQALEVTKRQADLRAGKQEASKQMRQLASQGQRLATAMRGLLKEHYGIREEKLAAFGLQPFRGRKPAPAETPAATPPSAPTDR